MVQSALYTHLALYLFSLSLLFLFSFQNSNFQQSGASSNPYFLTDSFLFIYLRTHPRDLFENCKGIILLSSIEAGFTFTGKLGTGIFLAKKRDGSWSVPCAIGLTTVGWGFVIGASMKESMIFIMDQKTLEALAVNNALKIGAQAEVTIAKWGRSYNGACNCSPSGAGGTASVAFSKGLFGGLTLEGAVVGNRHAVNEAFYGTDASVLQIITSDEITMPTGTKIDEVYRKLDLLKNGGSS